MATTSRPITELVVGIRTTADVVVASGKARFYQPGTLTPRDVYSDDVCTSAITQPLTLNAAGQYRSAYSLEPVRMIVKDSTETTTYYDGLVNVNRHDSVYITHASINGGAETTLETVLGTATTALGTDFQYKESSTATARNYVDWMGELVVSVKDFGALGDDANNDTTAIQAACDRVEARGGGWVYVPKGIYRITAPVTIDTVGVKIRGAGRGIAVFKQYTTTVNSITVNLGSAVDSKITIKDISITASTTTSGKGIEVINGDRIAIYNVAVALHRVGIDTSAVAGSIVKDCVIESTDDNAAAQGIDAGARGRVADCEAISGTDNGDGITLAADARVEDCYISNFAVGALISGARAACRGLHVTGATTGISITGANVACATSFVTSCTTGVSVGAVAYASVSLCSASSCTTDLSVNASATNFAEFGNGFAGTVTNASDTTLPMPLRWQESTTTDGTVNPTFTPDISGGKYVQTFGSTHAAAAVGATVANHSTATLAEGDIMLLVFYKTGANQLNLSTWGAQYLTEDATAMPTTLSVTSGNVGTIVFRWYGTAFRRVFMAGFGANYAV